MDVNLEDAYACFQEENPSLEWIQGQQPENLQLLIAIAAGSVPDTAHTEQRVAGHHGLHCR